MYDFLDKIGLKAVLEAIKGKIPTSLPANGGNADTVDNYHVSEGIHSSESIPPEYFTNVARIDHTSKMIESWNTRNIKVALADRATNAENADTVDGLHADDFIYPRAMLSNIDLNTILYPCSALIYGDCTNMPPVESWGTLLCYSGGTGSHVQLWATATDSSMFKRHYDGVKWSDWKEISTTPIKKISFPSVGTNAGGGGALFSADFGTPITIACTSRGDTQCTPFYYGDGNHWLLLAKDATTLDPIPAGTYSFDVWYI